MTEERLTRISKFLSKHLRHQPESIGLKLETGGWVGVDQLLAACSQNRMPITRDQLQQVVAENSKQRFSFDGDGTRIRANQGHSIQVDLELPPTVPPAILFHGTGHQTAAIISREGLLKLRRQHVHLSADIETAVNVGGRHGRPTVFTVDARAMHAAGHSFYCSSNGVWLVDSVPPQYLALNRPGIEG